MLYVHRYGLSPRWLACVAVACLISGGCESAPDGPQTYPVTGVVTQGGQPVQDALVAFTPADGEAISAGAQVRTAEDGEFDVSITLDQGKSTQRGLPTGKYSVTVVKMETAGDASLDNPPKNVLPAKYASPATTPLEAVVQPDGENQFKFEL
jgi:hypothetical protein